ncbi:MAG: hypothetical protein PHD43_19300 [Methylococcales bacterium]|nr:hypothetical protein [Methylococcales bacterium]
MTSSGITRRQWLIGSVCLGLSLSMATAVEEPGFGVINNMEPYPRNADEALVRLENGNRRFWDD